MSNCSAGLNADLFGFEFVSKWEFEFISKRLSRGRYKNDKMSSCKWEMVSYWKALLSRM